MSRKYNLLIDFTYINGFRFCAISLQLYAGRLIQGFRDSETFNVAALVWRGFEDAVDELAGFKVDKIVVDAHSGIIPSRTVTRVFGLIPFKSELEKRHIDAVIMPFHFECIYYFPKKYNHHFIVQDMIPHHLIQEKNKPVFYWIWCLYRRWLNRKAKCFISISEKTREELKRYEGKDSVVVYNSIPFDFSLQEQPVEELVGKRYILNVNRFAKYKNAQTLIRAFALLKDRIPQILYLKGDDRHPDDFEQLVALVKDLGLKDRVHFDRTYRSESELRYMYAHADLFVTPSLMEGFGWTPIEAAILKVPVLTSNLDVMREVACGKLETFDPHSPEDLAAHMERILNNPPDEQTRQELADFFLERYSLKTQMEGLTKVLLNNIENK